MNTTEKATETDNLCIETDWFIFEAPLGYEIERLDEEAELNGPKGELLIVSSYSVSLESSQNELEEFSENVRSAMMTAAEDTGLFVSEKLKRETAPSDFLVWSIKAEADDQSHFFDQYAIINHSLAVMVTIEGDYEDRTSSALVEEAVHAIEFN